MPSHETQRTVCEWAETTFGPVTHPSVLLDRAMIEMEELRDAVKDGDTKEAGKETADVVILLYRLMETMDLDLQSEVTSKMAENRSRKWRPKGDGTGSHIPK